MIILDFVTKPRNIVFLLLIIIISSCNNKKKENEPKDKRATFFSILYNTDDLTLTIKTDIEQLINNKDSLGNMYQDATFISYSKGKEAISAKVEVRPRGVTRRALCEFPPIMIKITNDGLKELNAKKTDNIKLVTFCMDEPKFNQLIFKEFLCYKLFNALTDTSFEVKLVKVNFQDVSGEFKMKEKFGFLIEPTDEMAQRVSCFYKEDGTTPIKKINKEQYKNFVVFQYMIGNTDWNLSGRHNIRMLDCYTDDGPKPVPYDFDYSGLVNAPYAKPHPMFSIDSVTERLFQFRGSVDEDFSRNFTLFQDKKAELYSIIGNFPHLDASVKAEIIAYLDQFYANISSPDAVKNDMLKARQKK